MIARIEAGQPPLPHLGSISEDPRESYYEEKDVRADAEHFIRHEKEMFAYGDPEKRKPDPYSESVASLLMSLHGHVRSQPWEVEFWEWILTYCPTCLPNSILDHLIETGDEGLICDLCHKSLPDQYHWKLAEHWDEALLTLANRRYLRSEYSPDQFEEILHAFPAHEWMLTNLVRLTPDCDQKAVLLARSVRAHPDADGLIENPSEMFKAVWTKL